MTKFEFYTLHHTMVSKTTPACTATSIFGMLYTRPVGNKTSYCNINVGEQQQNEQIFSNQDAVSLHVKKPVVQPTVCHTANSVVYTELGHSAMKLVLQNKIMKIDNG